MNYLTSSEIRKRYLDFFASKQHAIIPSSSLVTTDDEQGGINPTLFVPAGMQPLIPYLLGKEHPLGTRLCDSQKCIRTIDLDDVGDDSHLTFFEMLGNWSLGDYFKSQSLGWSYEFLTDKEVGLGLDPSRLYVTVFQGSIEKPYKDLESIEIWKKIGMPEHRIYFRSEKDNWWSAGETSPSGPCSEIYYDMTGKLGDLSQSEFEEADERRDLLEVWNNVFMSMNQVEGKVVGELPKKNVDTGMGFERIVCVVQNGNNIYESDLFKNLLEIVEKAGIQSDISKRIICDHIKAACFMIGDGVTPSNKDRGYILRRILRRSILKAKSGQENINVKELFESLIQEVCSMYSDAFPETSQKQEKIKEIIFAEDNKFETTLESGLKAFEKGERDAFILFTTFGFPLELIKEIASEKGITINEEDFYIKMKKHSEISKGESEVKFTGGLCDHEPKTIAHHSAHHLLLAALQSIVSSDIKQRGSNVTQERLRIDISYGEKISKELLEKVQNQVNEWIAQDLEIAHLTMDKSDAEKTGAQMEFGAKYPDMVSVYFIGEKVENAISKEFCGGPHMSRTGNLGTFIIDKEEASSSGVRRIKAHLQ
jgi:alanyl-tRNA synthetase